MRLRVFTRPLTAAGLLLLAAASTPAFGQTADVAVTLTAGAAGSTASLGTAKTFKLTVKNNGPSHATSFTVDGTFTPPAAPYNSYIKIDPVAGCTPTGGSVCTGGGNNGETCTTVANCPDSTSNGVSCAPPGIPCKVTLAAPLVSGASTSVSIPITVRVPPKPLPTAPADCPSGDPTVGPFFVRAVVSVPAVFQGTTSVDPNLGDNTTPPLDVAVTPWTDIAISDASATPNASEGQVINYSVTIQNYGPCAATTTFSDFGTPATVLFDSASGCGNDATFAGDAGCDLSTPDFAVGETRTYTTNWTVLTFPKSVIKAAIPVTVDVVWDNDVINGPDPVNPDHASSVNLSTAIDLSKNDSGCSTGGAGTLLGLLALVALRFARRRAS